MANTAAAASEKIGAENIFCFDNAEAFTDAAADILKEGDAVLVKGSHGMHMEKAAEFILNMGA